MNIPRFILKMNWELSVAWLAQSVEHETLNLRVGGSSPPLGALCLPEWVLTSNMSRHTLFMGHSREIYCLIHVVSIV